MGWRQWKKGLFTHEDPVNVHKLFGFPCLLHYLYRTMIIATDPLGDMHFKKGHGQTVALIAMHFMLSTTSLVFKIPKVRRKGGQPSASPSRETRLTLTLPLVPSP